MKRYHIALLLYLFSGSLTAGVTSLACDPDRFSLAKPDATYAYGSGYEKYEFAFEYLDDYWTGVVFQFYPLPNSNPILAGVEAGDTDAEVLRKVFRNASTGLMEGGIADKVSAPFVTGTPQGDLLSFAADSIVGRQHFGLFVQPAGDDSKILIRTHYISGSGSKEAHPEQVILKVVNALTENCVQDAA